MLKVKNKTFFLLFLLSCHFLSAQVDTPPSITATGRQAFCKGSAITIATDFTITDPDDTGIDAFFIQISSGYQSNFDRLELLGTHPSIRSSWSSNEGKLTFRPLVSGTEILFSDLEAAVKAVVFTTTATMIVPEKSFSLSIDDANYLQATGHFYKFIPSVSITWDAAKIAAENSNYYGRQGYLATLTSQEEADFAGKQAAGSGWIGGSDAENEGVWKWVTGPEAGTVFWNGAVNGSTPNYANWNNNEPNNQGDEDYAHITDSSIGRPGAWNDLGIAGGGGLYQAKGYIVEYGTSTDLPLNIVANTSIYLPEILTTTGATVCDTTTATISATPSEGTVLWFDVATGGSPVGTGVDFTTPVLSSSTTYFATVSVNGCATLDRTPVDVVINQSPSITSTTEALICSGSATLSATASAGDILWYETSTSLSPIFTGAVFETPSLSTTTSYYVEASVGNCSSSIRTQITAVIDATLPRFDLEKTQYSLCEDIGFVTLSTTNPQDSYTYIWTKDGLPFAGNSATNIVTSAGIYGVKAVSIAGCESLEKEMEVIQSAIATITHEDVLINDNSENNSIEILTDNLGIGNYEFAMDNIFGTYQPSPIFENLSVGIHTLFIKETKGCGIVSYPFSILKYPKFFTPNNDGIHDFWNINGMVSGFYTEVKVTIYNRFGQVLTVLDNALSSWDGTFNGKTLPSSNYWFSIQALDTNGRRINSTGNFSLLR